MNTFNYNEFIKTNIMNISHQPLFPGLYVIEVDSGRFGYILEFELWKKYGGRNHPAIQYEDDINFISTAHNDLHFTIIKDKERLK